MKYFHVMMLCLVLTSCSSLATGVATSLLDEQPTLSVDAQVGDRNAQLGDKHQVTTEKNDGIITVTSDASQNSKEFHEAKNVNIQEGFGLTEMILFALGWLCPSLGEMYREVKSWFIK